MKEMGPRSKPKICLLRYFQKNNWKKVEKSSKNGQDKKSLTSSFAHF